MRVYRKREIVCAGYSSVILCIAMTDPEAVREFLLAIVLIAIAIVIIDICITLWNG